MNKDLREDILVSFWLPLRKSNFINEIDEYNKNNLVSKIIKLASYYDLGVKNFNINLTEYEHDNIFKLKETSEHKRAYIRKHLIGSDEDTIDIFESKVNDTLSEYKYHISKRREIKDFNLETEISDFKNFSKISTDKLNSFDVNFKRNLLNYINNISLDFTFTDESIKILENKNIIKKNSKAIGSTLLKGLTFNFIIDEYGFYFINTEMHSILFYDNINTQLRELFVKMFLSLSNDAEFNILTYDQKNIIKDGLLYEYDLADPINRLKSDNLEKTDDFFKKIITVYRFKDFTKKESFSIKTKKEVNYILDYRNDHELKQRVYTLPFLENCFHHFKFNKTIVKNWILHTKVDIKDEKIEYLYKLFLQDEIEKKAINGFLEISTSINYIGEIINHIKEARDDLRNIINLTTTEEDTSDNRQTSNNEMTEDTLARYIETIFSKIPNLKTIDTFLQEAYYIKIGNYSSVGRMEESESIYSIYQYLKWKNLLENIDNTAQSLETILNVYQNRQSLEELEEIRRNELSTSDKNDVRTISNSRETVVLDNDERDFLLILSILIALSGLYKDSWTWILNLYISLTGSSDISKILSIVTAILIFYSIIKSAPYLSKFIFQSNRKKPVYFFGINTVELRSKKKLNIEVPHEDDHDFTKKINTILESIEKNINDVTLLKKARKRILFTRVNPKKRVIQIKYIFEENRKNKNKDFLDLRDININDKHTKIKFFVVYSFILKQENREKNNSIKFCVYNNFVKVFYNLGSTKHYQSVDDESEIRKRLYEIFLKEFNVH